MSIKLLYFATALLFMSGCTEKHSTNTNYNVSNANADSVINKHFKAGDSLTQANSDSSLMQLSREILKNIRSRNFKQFSSYIHPLLGVRFSPYGNIDTINHQKLNEQDLNRLSKSLQKITWGFYDGSGDSMKLDIRNYFRRFVYDADFLNAEKTAINKFIGAGNSLNNLAAIYTNCDFTEFYFSGFDPKYKGLDWKTLRLVFKQHKNKLCLVAIVHDQWTI